MTDTSAESLKAMDDCLVRYAGCVCISTELEIQAAARNPSNLPKVPKSVRKSEPAAGSFIPRKS
jgi:hypothetical protein